MIWPTLAKYDGMTAPVCNHSKHSLGIIPPPFLKKLKIFQKLKEIFLFLLGTVGKNQGKPYLDLYGMST